MAFELSPLPWSRDALAPHMSAETLDYHHGKHHRAYVDKVNGWIGEKSLEGKSLVEIVKFAGEKGDKGLFNNAAQAWNHNLFWLSLAPATGQQPTGALSAMIAESFGSPGELLTRLKDQDVGNLASGWARSDEHTSELKTH